MITKKQRRSSRKNMANRHMKRYFLNMATLHLANTQQASAVMPNQKSSGYTASLKRASGRGN
jgi:hypothetical protein